MNYILLILLVIPLPLSFVFMQELNDNKNEKEERKKAYKTLFSILPLLVISLNYLYNSLLNYKAFTDLIFSGVLTTYFLLTIFSLIYIIKKSKNKIITN